MVRKFFHKISSFRNRFNVVPYSYQYLFKLRSRQHFIQLKKMSRYGNIPRLTLYAGILSSLGLQKEEEEPVDPVVLTIKRAILLMQHDDFDTSEQMLHVALKMAQERLDPTAETYIYDIMANLAYQKHDFPKAEKLFVEVMKRMISIGTPQDDNAIIEMSLKLATIYAEQSQDLKATEGFQFCINTQQKKMLAMQLGNESEMSELEKDTLVLWAMSVDWYARYLLAKGQFKLAQEHFEKAFEVSEKMNGPDGEQTLVLMNDISTAATLTEEFDKAIDIMQEAIRRGRNSPDLPTFYCNLGAIYLRKGDNDQARTACSQALRLSRKTQHKEAEADAKGCLEEIQQMTKK